MTSPRLGARPDRKGTEFAVRAPDATGIELCLFDAAGRETRLPMTRDGDLFRLHVEGVGQGARYGYRADGQYDPARGMWFDLAKLLVDPWAVEIDRPYVYDPRLAAPRGEGGDTAPLVPKAVVADVASLVEDLPSPPPQTPPHKGEGVIDVGARSAGENVAKSPAPLQGGVGAGSATESPSPLWGGARGGGNPGGLIYELNVRAFTIGHPAVPEEKRGTVAALTEPAVIGHLTRIGVDAVELMPVTAWIDERHLPPLGLRDAWGYNPVTFMALDPRLAPGGIAELRDTVSALHRAGIATILDLVFNHTGESDVLGPTLSLRGLDNLAAYRHAPDGTLVNDTGTGNTVRCDHPAMRRLILDSLRHFVLNAGVDGFRFDLAPVLGRDDRGFDPHAALLDEMRADPLLQDRVLIAEPWDIGPGGHQLGRFGPPFLEWNDRARDGIRRFWRGDAGAVGDFATRLAGSSDVFGGDGTRTVNFVAAHDGMTLADITRYADKHNEANGEENRDGHDENLSWNCGVEGETDDPAIAERREADVRALLSTLFASRGAIMLTAGDEFGRTQRGNNNAYAQDNDLTWLDWDRRDRTLEAFMSELSAFRRACPPLAATGPLSGETLPGATIRDVEWLTETGCAMTEADWRDPSRHRLTMVLGDAMDGTRSAVIFNADRRACVHTLPGRAGFAWTLRLVSSPEGPQQTGDDQWLVAGRCVVFLSEVLQGRAGEELNE